MSKPKVVHYFDVEDIFFGNRHDVHGISRWAAEFLSEVGLTGTFNLSGVKARALVKDGRRDVIDAIKKHEIGNHTTNGSYLPAMPEYLSDKGWDDGVQAVEDIDGACFDIIREIFGKEACHYHEHFDCISAQAYAAFFKRGKVVSSMIGNVYGPYPDHGVAWYCGNLSFNCSLTCSFPRPYHLAGWDTCFEQWKEKLECLSRQHDFFNVFGFHPFEVRSTIFTDRFYAANGKNLPPEDFGLWGTPEVFTDSQLEITKANYRRAVQYLAEQSRVEVTTYRALATLYGYQKKFIERSDLEPFCDVVTKNWTVAIGRYFSPAELMVALCRALVQSRNGEKITKIIPRTPVLGPTRIPVGWPEIPELSSDFVLRLAEQTLAEVERTGHLPANYTDGKRDIGPSALLRGLCSNYLDVLAGKNHGPVKLWKAVPIGTDNQKIMPQWPIQERKLWGTHFLRSPEFNPFNLYKFKRLMDWTLKPADTLEHFQKENIEVEDNPFPA